MPRPGRNREHEEDRRPMGRLAFCLKEELCSWHHKQEFQANALSQEIS